MSLTRREAGILLHPSSLPGGRFGPAAMRFLDWLSLAGFGVWQTLPLVPTDRHGSPYASRAANAINSALIDPGQFFSSGLVDRETLNGPDVLAAAQRSFVADANAAQRRQWQTFLQEQAYWLEDYVLFESLRARHGGQSWWNWPRLYRDRDERALRQARAELAAELDVLRFTQFVAHRQWRELKHAANRRGIRMFGDLPLYVAHDSVDVWSHREAFQLDDDGQPPAVAGVPPDYFSADGQRWGNPLYDWPVHEADDFRWWQTRIGRQRALFDILRVDHFRGLESYWAVPFAEKTAINGAWYPAPGDALLASLTSSFPELNIVAEDLGIITDEVTALRDRFGLPGMKVMQFAFDGSADNPFLPWNILDNSVVYTGTHDNDTTLGWAASLPDDSRHFIAATLGLGEHGDHSLLHGLTDAVLGSAGLLAVLPLQDVLELGAAARMNTPGTDDGNWQFSFSWEQLAERDPAVWRQRLADSGRLPPE